MDVYRSFLVLKNSNMTYQQLLQNVHQKTLRCTKNYIYYPISISFLQCSTILVILLSIIGYVGHSITLAVLAHILLQINAHTTYLISCNNIDVQNLDVVEKYNSTQDVIFCAYTLT